MQEFWKPIKGYEGLYEVSNFGRVKSYYSKPPKILKSKDNGNGYLYVMLYKNKTRKEFYVHRLVAMEFVDNYNNYNCVNHLDFNVKNNKFNNLEWCTQKENVHHSKENMKKRKSITHSNTKEKYITYRKSRNSYRVTIDKKEYNARTLDDAIKKRDEILNGKKIS